MRRDLDAWAVFGVAILAYLGNLGHGFTYDDRYIVERNPLVQSLDFRALAATPYWGELVDAGLYRPLTLVSFGLNRLMGPDAWSFHLVNDLLHAATSVLVLLLLRALSAGRFVSVGAALIFALHPLQTEPVNSLVGRADVLALGLVLAALLLHVRERSPLAVGALVFAALCAKESGAFALGLFAAYYLLFSRRIPAAALAGAAGYLALRVAVLGGLGIAGREVGFLDNPLAGTSLGTRLLAAPTLLFEYASLVIWPARLSADYSFDALAVPGAPDVRALAGVVVAAALLGLALRARGLAGLGALGFLLPLTGALHLFFPLGTIFAERLVYVSMFGASLLVAMGVARLGRARIAVLALVLVACSARSVLRTREWSDNETLFRAAVRTTPASARAHFLLGAELLELKQPTEAATRFARGLEIYPEHLGGRMSLGQACLESNQPECAAEAFLAAYATAPGAATRAEAVSAALSAGRARARESSWDAADAHFASALEVDPGNLDAMTQRGLVAERTGRTADARRWYGRALELDPNYAPALVNLASVEMGANDLPAAEALFRRTIELAPDSYEAYNGLGIALARQGRVAEAEASFRAAMAVAPGLSAAQDNLRAIGKTP